MLISIYFSFYTFNEITCYICYNCNRFSFPVLPVKGCSYAFISRIGSRAPRAAKGNCVLFVTLSLGYKYKHIHQIRQYINIIYKYIIIIRLYIYVCVVKDISVPLRSVRLWIECILQNV